MCLPEDLQVAPGEVVPVLRSKDDELDLYPYLRRILTAKVYDLAVGFLRVRDAGCLKLRLFRT